MIEFLSQPWPWYVSGAILGGVVPLLLLIGNKRLAVSSSLGDLCALVLPRSANPFGSDRLKSRWNLFFVGGIVLGGFVAGRLLSNGAPVGIDPQTRADLQRLGIHDFSGLLPADIFSTASVVSARSLLILVFGGVLVGFGARWAGGCTSGHTIVGLADLQWPSLLATACFFVGGLLSAFVLLPVLLSLSGG